jgi:hypothetical protein
MSNFNRYVLKKFITDITELGYNYKDLETYSNWKYRYICYKLNYFLQHIPLCKLKQKMFFEAVFIDFRILPNIEFVIRNAIFKLGNEWSYTIVCGIDNYNYIYNMVNNIDKNIRIIRLEHNNITQDEYSKILTTESFWDELYGKKILIYQEDSLIFHNNINPFLIYDYIGAPFLKSCNDTPNNVGNGGLSLRNKYKMLEVIKKCKPDNLIVNSTTQKYMEENNLKYHPEDVYFSKNMQELHIGDVADWDTAYKFSSEQIFNPDSFGGHQFWISNNNWQEFLKKLFKFNVYNPKSNLDKYLRFKGLSRDYNKNKQIKNAFDVDLEFFCHINSIEFINDKFTLEYIKKIGLDGFIYHPKQLFNIFSEHIELFTFLNKIYAFYNKKIYTIRDFANKYIYNTNFEYLADLLIKKKYNTINNNFDTLLLVFLGNEELGMELLYRIIKYKEINTQFNVAFCINKNLIKNTKNIKSIIKNNFDFYCIYYSREMGTDITPTLLMYNDIIKNHEMKHIIKLHTKGTQNLYNNLTDFLLQRPIYSIIENQIPKCNCIGQTNSYIHLNNDIYNRSIREKYIDYINLDSYFVAGTIFYTTNIVLNKVLEFIKHNNYRSYLLNNLYENNSINQEFSPIHFLERLFGCIKL